MNYNKFPTIHIKNHHSFISYLAIIQELKNNMSDNHILVIDTYMGVNDEEVLSALINGLHPDHVILSNNMFYDEEKLNELMQNHLTDDRVRGIMYYGTMDDFINQEKKKEFQNQIKTFTGLTLIYGVGASLISKGNTLVYADIARWEIQLRYRAGMPNFKCTNHNEDILKKYKRGYFIEWRICDKHKKAIFDDIDYYLDTNKANEPKMISGNAFLDSLKQVAKQPFRLVPYFDPGVWGGQWMKEVCGLDPKEKNYAWSFDGVPEENSIYLQFENTIIESPAMNVVLYQPVELLGMKNYCRFGAEFPIRFDFLDTIGGQNLSLQVHPTTEFIKSHYGMTYTQDESYYILDCKEGAGVYLGLKEGINPQEMIDDLYLAQTGKQSFNANKYINRFPAHKHDHFLIPAGTVHCSSKDCMVLEVSATPYIFTFKLFDWDRVGLDGLPRPIHIDEGKEVIQWNRTTSWVKDNLVNQFETIEDNENYKEIKTGLHELEFIETRVVTSSTSTYHHTHDGVHMLNLVDGKAVLIQCIDSTYELHYAETIIIPAAVGEYTIHPIEGEYKILKAYVRH